MIYNLACITVYIRLQCPQTHAGLVVAFTTTTLSPLVDPNIKFKWYRVEEDIVQIDESARGWYPPTADDIGRKIMAQCQDEFDQGYCRYAEVCFLLVCDGHAVA